MAESIEIKIKREGSIEKMIKKVKSELTKWFSTLENPFEPSEDGLKLVKLEKSKSTLIYEYMIVRGVYKL